MQIYGIIGYPLGHSCSPRYFNEKFQKENIAAEFITNDVLTSLPTQTTVKVTVDGNDYSYTYDLNNN